MLLFLNLGGEFMGVRFIIIHIYIYIYMSYTLFCINDTFFNTNFFPKKGEKGGENVSTEGGDRTDEQKGVKKVVS